MLKNWPKNPFLVCVFHKFLPVFFWELHSSFLQFIFKLVSMSILIWYNAGSFVPLRCFLLCGVKYTSFFVRNFKIRFRWGSILGAYFNFCSFFSSAMEFSIRTCTGRPANVIDHINTSQVHTKIETVKTWRFISSLGRVATISIWKLFSSISLVFLPSCCQDPCLFAVLGPLCLSRLFCASINRVFVLLFFRNLLIIFDETLSYGRYLNFCAIFL